MKALGDDVEKEKTVATSEIVTLSYVGSLVEDRQPCRWVEVKNVIGDEEGGKVWIRKMLVTEAGLLHNDGYLTDAKVLRAWLQRPDRSITKLDEKRGFPYVFIGTPGSLKHMARSDEMRDFSIPSLRLNAAEAWRGKRDESRSLAGLIKVRTDTEYTAWLHPDLPTGFVRLEWKSTISFSARERATTTKVVEYSLADAGMGARSELPDHN
ncbi:MAG TPA: hypothetical protein VKU82_07895 [Planctomycetaceae bacterium]|nr:hypothetical protein [Planctomycetaceae bacterium]